MKNYYLISTFLVLCFQISFSQNYEIVRETKKLIDNREIHLNGGMRSQFGGKSRTYIKFDLPPNTVEWFYSFTTTKGQNGTKNLNLALQLGSILADGSTLTSTAMSTIKVPEGVATADIYLIDKKNYQPFLNKVTFEFDMEGTVENTKQAIVKVNDVKKGTWFLGLKNPSSMNGINLNIEVVAITETKKVIPKSEQQQKAELYGNLGWTKFEQAEYEECIRYCNKSYEVHKLGWVIANKGVAQLVCGQMPESIESYVSALAHLKNDPNAKNELLKIRRNLEMTLKIYPNLDGADEIIQLIKLEQKNLANQK